MAWTFDQRSLYGLLHWEGIHTYVSPAFIGAFSDDFPTDDIDDFESTGSRFWWHCGIVALWYRGIVSLWHCGIVALWHRRIVALWYRGIVALWHCFIVTLWHCGIMASWHCGILNFTSGRVWEPICVQSQFRLTQKLRRVQIILIGHSCRSVANYFFTPRFEVCPIAHCDSLLAS